MHHGLALISIGAVSALLIAAAPTAVSLEGYWRGSGIISYSGGSDHAECGVRYTRASGRRFSYTATCSTESGKYDLKGIVTNTSSNGYSGTVVGSGKQGEETGHVFLTQFGKHLSLIATSKRGSARMTLAELG